MKPLAHRTCFRPPLALLFCLSVSFWAATGAFSMAEAAPKAKKQAASAKKTAPEAAESAAVPTEASPMAALKKSDAQLKKILAKQAPNWAPEADIRSDEVRKVVGSFLDYEELARRALARHWEGLSPAQRTDFVQTLRDLVERSYVRQIQGQTKKANYDLDFEKEQIDGSTSTVWATLNTATPKGKKIKVALEYKMLVKAGRWLVYDVVTDEQSLLENYRAEFSKIINKEGFDALLKRMKKKLGEPAKKP